MISFKSIWLASALALVSAAGCESAVEAPRGGGGHGTSTGNGGAEAGATSSGGGGCIDGPVDPDCGCLGWESSNRCRCDCGGTLVEVSQLSVDCQHVATAEACPDGLGGGGGAPTHLSCELLGTEKICGP